MKQVTIAGPFNAKEVGSLGRASCMLIRQHNFPSTYSEEDIFFGADHDHIMNRNYARGQEIIKKYSSYGEGGLWNWLQNTTQEKAMQFMVEYLDADTSVKWTGFRVMLTVHRGNGWPILTLELFAKHPNSRTRVYTGVKAPNIKCLKAD